MKDLELELNVDFLELTICSFVAQLGRLHVISCKWPLYSPFVNANIYFHIQKLSNYYSDDSARNFRIYFTLYHSHNLSHQFFFILEVPTPPKHYNLLNLYQSF